MPSPGKNRPSLGNLQKWIRWALTEPRGIDFALEGPPSELRRPEPKPRALSALAGNQKAGVRRRLSVYADAYFLRLADALGNDFRATRRVLGEEAFSNLIAGYLVEHPSDSTDIGDAGERLPNFLRSHAYSKERPYLPELAMLERTAHVCLRIQRLPPLRAEDLDDIPIDAWARARAILDPTVRLLEFRWPVHRLWKARNKPLSRASLRLEEPSDTFVLVYRDDDWVQARPIDLFEWKLIQSLQKGRGIEAAIRSSQKDCPEISPDRVQEAFSHWTSIGVIKKIQY